MNKILTTTLFVWFTVTGFLSFAQKKEESPVYTEKIELHTNTNFLITGETLYYTIHCLETQKNEYSTLSKLAYVELIGEDETPYFQTKVSLTEGAGSGDFFLSSRLPSGNYTLLAYTKWMRNFSEEIFFQKQITIINPFVKPPATVTQNVSGKMIPSVQLTKNETSQVSLAPDKKEYQKRQKAVVVIRNNNPQACRVSFNVQRYYQEIETTRSSENPKLKTGSPVKTEHITFLPDLRGETLTGIVQEKDSHRPVANQNIYLSAAGPSSVFQISKTDSAGRFYFSTKNIQTQAGIRFQVDEGTVPLEIILKEEFLNSYRNFKPAPLSLDSSIRTHLEQRSIYSQIENAYFNNKRDSILNAIPKSFFGTPDKVYKLDDFTRFPTMEDIFREYMYEVVVTKREGKFNLQLINTTSKSGARFLNTPLILVDGIRIFDVEALMNYNPLLIKSISLVTRKYVYGGILFDGIMSVHTYTGDSKELTVSSVQKEYTPWQQRKKYYSPDYGTQKLERIPDYRIQLAWNPAITIAPGQEFVGEFYTSDVEGQFLIEVRGFTSMGDEVNIRDIIEVRK